jgi:hypothetical protein
MELADWTLEFRSNFFAFSGQHTALNSVAFQRLVFVVSFVKVCFVGWWMEVCLPFLVEVKIKKHRLKHNNIQRKVNEFEQLIHNIKKSCQQKSTNPRLHIHFYIIDGNTIQECFKSHLIILTF